MIMAYKVIIMSSKYNQEKLIYNIINLAIIGLDYNNYNTTFKNISYNSPSTFI
jgi:hypothetical protein